jgi:IS30 family transposase
VLRGCHTQLTQEQRYQIAALLTAGHSQTKIADVLDIYKSTIHQELKRNRGVRGHRPKQPHDSAWTVAEQSFRHVLQMTHWDWLRMFSGYLHNVICTPASE